MSVVDLDDAEAARSVRRHNPWARPMAVGMLLLQIVWIFAVPPFRGTDEFDHSYRAAAVAAGEWAPPPSEAARGTGATLRVPTDIVNAAEPECRRLPYTESSDCASARDGAWAEVASGAGRYHPLFYWVVGQPSQVLDGTAALYGMRAVGALLCWGMFVLALLATRAWALGRWPFLALCVTATPVLLFSSSIVAPNGLEIMAAIALWCALIALTRLDSPRHDPHLLVTVVLSASILVTLRSLGPLWCGLILVSVLLAWPPGVRRCREIVLSRKGLATLALVSLATAASLVWILTQKSLVIGRLADDIDPTTTEKVSGVLRNIPLWALQSIAAFPSRTDPAHPVVYAAFVLVAIGLLLLAFRVSDRPRRVALVLLVFLTFAVPSVISYATLDSYGLAWQGRYTMPFSVGIFLVAGASLDARGKTPQPQVVVALGLCYVLAHAWSPVALALDERTGSPGVANGAWVLVPPVVLAFGAVLGAGLLWCGAAGWRRPRSTPQEAP